MARDCYPDGLFEFDTTDRSAPDDRPPAMLRLFMCNKYEMIGLVQQLLTAIVTEDERPCFTFSGKLKEVDE